MKIYFFFFFSYSLLKFHQNLLERVKSIPLLWGFLSIDGFSICLPPEFRRVDSSLISFLGGDLSSFVLSESSGCNIQPVVSAFGVRHISLVLHHQSLITLPRTHIRGLMELSCQRPKEDIRSEISLPLETGRIEELRERSGENSPRSLQPFVSVPFSMEV